MIVCRPNALGIVPTLDLQPILAIDTFRGGWVNRTNGELHINSVDAPVNWNDGYGIDSFGRLCVSMGGTIDHFIEGLPVDIEGRVVGQIGQVPLTTDPFIAGIRVGINGVYLI